MPLPNKDYLLWLFARRDYPRSDLIQKLRKRGMERDAANALLDELKEQGYFRENAFGEQKLRSLVRKGYGARAVRGKLGQKKVSVSNEQIQETYADLQSSPEIQLRELFNKESTRAEKISSPQEKQKFKARLLRKALSRGHSMTQALAIFKELFF